MKNNSSAAVVLPVSPFNSHLYIVPEIKTLHNRKHLKISFFDSFSASFLFKKKAFIEASAKLITQELNGFFSVFIQYSVIDTNKYSSHRLVNKHIRQIRVFSCYNPDDEVKSILKKFTCIDFRFFNIFCELLLHRAKFCYGKSQIKEAYNSIKDLLQSEVHNV